jgi:phage shock protein E
MNEMISRRKRAGSVFLVLLFASTITACAEENRLRTVAPDEFFSLYEEQEDDGAVLIDVRTPEEYEAGHAPSAVNIDYYGEGFREVLDDLDREGVYFLYCRSGNRSSSTLGLMEDMGFKEVYDLSGGWSRNSSRLRELGD